VNTWRVILATLVLFGAGVVTGGLLVQHSFEARLARPRQPGSSRPTTSSPGGMRYEFLRRMGRDLDLTADQRERIDKILSQSQEQTRKILREESQKTKAAFREVLTPEQQAKFDDLIKRSQRAHEQRRSSGGTGEHSPESVISTNIP
jgi:Spy/CpxP family protein refolding chaperone